jgi:hypothetical protein
VRQSRTYYIYIFGKDVNNFAYLVVWLEATWLLKGVNMVCSSNSPKLAEIEAAQRMTADAHGVMKEVFRLPLAPPQKPS